MTLLNILPKDWVLHRHVAIHIIKYRKLLLSYSGGLDSTVLLDILSTLRNINNNNNCLTSSPLILRAAYVHHGVNRYADMWSNHCNHQCKMRNIPFQVIHIKDYYKINNIKNNMEASLRYFRYQKLYDHLNLQEILLTAHHMDDQVETLFLALKRGSGPNGLSGMNINTFYYRKYRILRPFLKFSRVQLKKYATDNNLVWIEDDTNNNIEFDRNFLRIKVLPLLHNRWPYFNKVVTRTSELCRNQENLLDELLLESLHQLIDVVDNSLFFEPFLKFSVLKRQALLRRWIAKFFINMPSYQCMHRIWKEVILSKCDATPILRLDQYLCRRFRKKIYLIPIDMMYPIRTVELNWKDLHQKMILPYNLGLLICQYLNFNENLIKSMLISDKDITFISNIFFNFFKKPGEILTHCIVRFPECNEKISIRFGHVNGLLYILNRNRGRKLKKIWQELGIPPWLRSRIPLLFYNDTLVAAIGVFITKDGAIVRKGNINKLLQISWIQDVFYYKFFRNSIQNYLK